MFDTFPTLKEKSKIAAILAEGMNLKEAWKITSIFISTISWGREQLQDVTYAKNNHFQDIKDETNEEKNYFKEFLYSYAPVTSGSVSDRRLPYNTCSEFYDVYIEKFHEMGNKTYSITTTINRIKNLNVKRGSFDRLKFSDAIGKVQEMWFLHKKTFIVSSKKLQRRVKTKKCQQY